MCDLSIALKQFTELWPEKLQRTTRQTRLRKGVRVAHYLNSYLANRDPFVNLPMKTRLRKKKSKKVKKKTKFENCVTALLRWDRLAMTLK